MPVDRIAFLTDFLAKKPTDDFARYALAMELAKVGRNDEALESYAILRAQNPDYPSGYFQAALLLQRLSRLEEARTWLKEGIEAATRVKDAHARREMEGVLAELELDEG